MNKLEAKSKAYLYATGKSPAPTTGTKAVELEGLCQAFYTSWQTEPGVEWDILSQEVGAGSVTATDTFELDEKIHFLSSRETARVRIENGSNINYYPIVNPLELSRYRRRGQQVCALVSATEIKFSIPFDATSAQFGGTIYVPAIVQLPELQSDSSRILIPQPEYLPWRIAAQYVLTNRQLNYLYDDLIAQANEFMKSMKKQNTSPSDATTNTGVDYFAGMGSVGSGTMYNGGSRTDSIF